jgi:hypothetical protein
MSTAEKCDDSKPIKNIRYYMYRYLQEFLEAFVAIAIFSYLNGTINFTKIINSSIIISIVTLILEEYNPAYKSSLKTGMISSIGHRVVRRN